MKLLKVFAMVTLGALTGMLLGGAFGFGAGTLAPNFFCNLRPWRDIEPRGAAIVMGATIGVLLGGGLTVFGITVQILQDLFGKGRPKFPADGT